MNLKALITTLVLGSSSAAMADSFTVSGSVKVNVGQPRPAPVHTTVADDCHDNLPSPAYHPTTRPPVVVSQPSYHVQPKQPVYRGPFYNPTNTIVGKDASSYKGWVAKAPMVRQYQIGKALWRPAATTWFDLTEATRIDSGRQFIKIGADKGQFKALKLQALGAGRSEIKQVGVELIDAYGNKKMQVVKLNTWINPQTNPSITIDLDGGYRQINRIIVYGSTDRGSAYKLLAM